MKKILYCMLLVAATLIPARAESESDYQDVTRPSAQELKANSTPHAMAINAVNALLNYDYNQASQMLTSGRKELWDSYLREAGDVESAIYYMLKGFDMQPWKEALANGYDLAVGPQSIAIDTNTGDVVAYMFPIVCIPSNEIGHKLFDEISNYDDYCIGIVVEKEDNQWKIDEIYPTAVASFGMDEDIPEAPEGYDDSEDFVIVYIDAEDPEGTVFHLDDECPVLHENNHSLSRILLLDTAIEQGYTPCSSCCVEEECVVVEEEE